MANIVVDVGHPAHVHLFVHAMRQWQAQGHNVLCTALDRGEVIPLLRHYELPYKVVYKRRSGRGSLFIELFGRTFSTYVAARASGADLFVSFGNPTVGLPAFLMKKPYFALTDTEHAKEQHRLFLPFATVIAVPCIFEGSFGEKEIRHNSYHELAYLHPDVFKPDETIINRLGLLPSEPFFVVRFVSWEATHDRGQRGFTASQKRLLLERLSKQGRVVLSIESGIPEAYQHYALDFPAEDIHHLLYYATLYVGEGATMAAEAAVLGTPSVFVNSLRLGYCVDLQDSYGLLQWHPSGKQALMSIESLLAETNLKLIWQERRNRMLNDKIALTSWMVEQVNQLLDRASH